MKFLTISKTEGFCLKDQLSPFCRGGDILVKLGACGICGSDINNIFGDSCKPTTRVGHELSGTIIKIGCKTNNLKIGDRVFVHHHCSCNMCHFCSHGNQIICVSFVDSIEPCGFSEEFLVPEWIVNNGGVIRLPENLNFISFL